MRKILIVVDMQNDFVTGALGSEDAQKILPGVRAKIDAYHKEDAEVIFTRDTHGEDYMQTNEGKHLPVPHCIKGTDGWQICSALTDGSDLQIELIGVCTDICVVSNALILKAYYPEATVKVDAGCCAGVTKKAHAAALQTMKSCQVEVTNEA